MVAVVQIDAKGRQRKKRLLPQCEYRPIPTRLPDRAQVGAIMAQRRKELGYTQQEVATALGTTQQRISDMEQGGRYWDGYEMVLISIVLGFDPMALSWEVLWKGQGERSESNVTRSSLSLHELEARKALAKEMQSGRSIREIAGYLSRLVKWLDEVE